jgi:hypothetical protein
MFGDGVNHSLAAGRISPRRPASPVTPALVRKALFLRTLAA